MSDSSSLSSVSEYDFEPIPGLPASLPKGEKMLWQGAPQWKSMALHVFHIRKVAVYFAILLVWRFFSASADGATVTEAALSALWLLPLALSAIGLLVLLAWGYSRSTVYTITDKRIVMRFGIALPMTINLPFSVIESAALKTYRDGSGDLPVVLKNKQRIAYLVLWPNVRPWRVKQPQPMLRALADATEVAELLAQALAAENNGTVLRVRKTVRSRPTSSATAAAA